MVDTETKPIIPGVAYPLKTKGEIKNNLQEYFNRLKGDAGSRFLFNQSGLWHQGIHLRASQFKDGFEVDKIYTIAKGRLLAYKVDSEYHQDSQNTAQSAVYSTGFFLLDHYIEYPKGNKLTFYSLYRHMAKLSEYSSESTTILGETYSKDGEIVIKDEHNKTVEVLPNGVLILVKRQRDKDKRNEVIWYKKAGIEHKPKTGSWSIYHSSYRTFIDVEEPGLPLLSLHKIKTEVDKEIVLDKPIEIAAGTELGLMGEYNQAGESNQRLLHLEVFTYDDIEAFREKTKAAYEEDKKQKRIKDNVLYVARNSPCYSITDNTVTELERTQTEIMVPLSEVEKVTLKQGEESKTYYDILPYLYHLSSDNKGKTKDDKSGIYVDDSHLTHGILFPGVNVYKEQSNSLCIFKMPLDEYLDPNNGKSLEEKNRLDGAFKGIMQELDLDKDKESPIKFEAGKLNVMSLSPIQHRRLTGIVVKHESEWKSTRAADFAKVCALYRENQKIELAECIDKRVKDLSISVKVGQFDTDREAYYVHPLGMIGWLSQDCIPFKLAREIALKVSGGFEGKTPRYDTLADNFDGAGMSWGIIQFNFGQGTLGPLLRKMKKKNVNAFNSAFSNHEDLETLNSALDSNKTDQINWAKNMQSESNRARWEDIFNNLAQIDEFNDIQLEAVKPYDDEAVRIIEWMRGLYPDLMKKVELKTFIALHDLAVQQGSIKKAIDNIIKKCSSSPPKTQDEFIRIVVRERAVTAGSIWRADCLSRRLGILNKKVTKVTHSGKTSSRDNINFKLIEDVFICDL